MPSPQSSTRSLLRIHLAVLLFGFPGLFAKWISLPSPMIVLGRVVFAALTLVFILFFKRRLSSARLTPRDAGLLALCGAILAVHWSLFFQSVRVSSVAVGLLSYSSFPVFTAFLEPLFFKERLNGLNIFFGGVCVLGIFLIIPRFNSSNAVFQGVLWGLGSGATFAVLTVLNKSLSRRRSSLVIAFYQDLFAVFFLLPLFFLSPVRPTPKDIALVALLGIFCTAGAHTLFISGMRIIKAQTAGLISSLEPVYGILLAFVFLKETPALRTLAGGAVILAAVLFITIKASSRTGRP